MGTDPFRLDGRVALVTGAGSPNGIGRAIGATFARAGAAVAFADVDVDGALRNATEFAQQGARTAGIAIDVTEEASVRRAVGETESMLGPVDILVNNAGITSRTKIWELSVEE